jgi:DNA polymerase-3 subunit epsilon
MLHQLLALTRPLIVPDVETTGLDAKDARIIEIGFQVWTSDGLQKEWRSLVNPGVPISPETTKVHGISDYAIKMCRECGFDNASHVGNASERGHAFKPWPTFAQLAPNLAKGFTGCDFAGKNVRYDLKMFASEFARAGVAWSYLGARIIDADRLEQLGEPRTLSSLYRKHVDKEPEDAHQALADVRMTTEVIAAQLRKYQTLPRDLDLLHAAQWPGRIDPDGKFKFVDGVACFANWGKHAGKRMDDPSVNLRDRRGENYWDFILKSDFSPDVKTLARDAKFGRFPEAK